MDTILGRLGYPFDEYNGSEQISALDEQLLLFEHEQSTTEIFGNEENVSLSEGL